MNNLTIFIASQYFETIDDYMNLELAAIRIDLEALEGYDKWFAYYKYPLRFPYKMKMWQYTSSGEVDGIEGGTDINIMFY